eukprot:15455399-Alexandrium_andersonii.AAC.1
MLPPQGVCSRDAGKSRPGLRTYARAVGPLARASQPHRTCARRSLHVQSPAVRTAAMETLARTPPGIMASPSLLLGQMRGFPWPSSGQRGCACAAG